jgi:hypothetical protein
MTKPPTYPARPVNGGPLHKALPKTGVWYAEAKYNGWYAHGCPAEGLLFNRQNELLSIAGEFKTALEIVRKLPFPWLTYEAMDRRHNLSRGSLVILDYPDRTKTYVERRQYLELVCAIAGIPEHKNLNEALPDNSVVLVYPYQWGGADQLYREILPMCNRVAFKNKPYYEGIVAKRGDSKYPFQLRSPDVEFPFWMKHRWAF